MKIKKGEGLMSQITSANHLAYSITEEDIKKMINSLFSTVLAQPRDPITGKFIKGPKISKYNNNSTLTVYGGKAFIDSFNKTMEDEVNKFQWKIMKDDEGNKSI